MMAKKAKKKAGTRVRDAGTGQYVNKGEAKRRPKTTVTERVKPKKK